MNQIAQPIVELLKEAQRKRDAALERVERAKAEAEKFAAEADAYRRALEAIGFDASLGATSGSKVTAEHAAKKPRMPSKKWAEIYLMLYMAGDEPYDYQSILDAANAANHAITEGAMRTQMMNAVNSGIFERVDAGKFKFTEQGLNLIDAGPKENEPPKGGSEAGEAPTSPEARGAFG